MSQSDTTTRSNTKLVMEGVAAEDIEVKSTILKVIVPELTPHATTGTVGAGLTSGVTKLKDRDGNSINTNTSMANHVVATWGGESGMREPPRVRAGEPVEVWKGATQDKYFWRSTGRGRDFRKTDRMVIEIGAMSADGKGGEKSDDNTYMAYLDSIDQKMGLKSSAANGEVSAFSVEFDMKLGTMVVSDKNDGTGNRIFMDTGAKSGTPILQMNLSSGATLKMEGDNAMISIPKKLLINAGERIVFNSPITIFNQSTAGSIIFNAANIAINGAKDIILTTSVMGINAASTKIAGVLVAAAARIADLVKGSAGTNYKATTVSRPAESPDVPGSNSPDTSMTGPPYQS